MGYKNYWERFFHTKNYRSQETMILITNLIPDTNYTFLVHAATVCGNSFAVKQTAQTEKDSKYTFFPSNSTLFYFSFD